MTEPDSLSAASERPDRNLALELVRVTEAAAMAAGRWVGRGDKNGADGVVVEGLVDASAGGSVPAYDRPAVAVFRPSAVSVFAGQPGGSPRNALAVTVTDLEPHGDQVRVRAGHLAAEVTLRSAAELGLAPGARVVFAVKASEVSVYRT